MAICMTRREGETVLITTDTGERIVVRVSDIQGNRVRLSFDASRHIPIVRGESAPKEVVADRS